MSFASSHISRNYAERVFCGVKDPLSRKQGETTRQQSLFNHINSRRGSGAIDQKSEAKVKNMRSAAG